MNVTPLAWVLTLVGVVAILGTDLVLVSRRPHKPTVREAARVVVFFVLLAVAFGGLVWAVWGSQYAAEFYAGWLTEYSLSLDNLFVFVIIMARFAVPAALQQTVLIIGILLALVLRGIFIAAGAFVIERFSSVFFLFGAFLIWTAWTLLRGGDEEEEFEENALIRWVGRGFSLTPDYHGVRLRVTVDGARLWTPMLIVMIAIGTTDLLFALDSIPAIFGLTKEPYLVFTANAFALMGLVQLFFVLGGLLDRLRYLNVGLSVILAFIGVKLILEALATNTLPFINSGEPVEWAPEIPVAASLGVIVVVLLTTAAASLLVDRRERADR
jgi:tellurite resistance protein TerC